MACVSDSPEVADQQIKYNPGVTVYLGHKLLGNVDANTGIRGEDQVVGVAVGGVGPGKQHPCVDALPDQAAEDCEGDAHERNG